MDQLKGAVLKAIEILLSKIDSTDRSTGALKATELVLQSDIQMPGDIAYHSIFPTYRWLEIELTC